MEDGAERAGGFGMEQVDADALGQCVRVLPVAGGDKALARRAVEGALALAADPLEADCDEFAQPLGLVLHRHTSGSASVTSRTSWLLAALARPSSDGANVGGERDEARGGV